MAKHRPSPFSRGPRVRAVQTPAPVVSKVFVRPEPGSLSTVWEAVQPNGNVVRSGFKTEQDANEYRDAFNAFCTPDGHSVYGKAC